MKQKGQPAKGALLILAESVCDIIPCPLGCRATGRALIQRVSHQPSPTPVLLGENRDRGSRRGCGNHFIGDLTRNQAQSAAHTKERGDLRGKPWVFPSSGALFVLFSRQGEKRTIISLLSRANLTNRHKVAVCGLLHRTVFLKIKRDRLVACPF